MSPSHANKKSVRYRCYVSQASRRKRLRLYPTATLFIERLIDSLFGPGGLDIIGLPAHSRCRVYCRTKSQPTSSI
jgi:hypothetical protein